MHIIKQTVQLERKGYRRAESVAGPDHADAPAGNLLRAEMVREHRGHDRLHRRPALLAADQEPISPFLIQAADNLQDLQEPAVVAPLQQAPGHPQADPAALGSPAAGRPGQGS